MPASQAAAITKGTILNISSNADVYERGERYYRDGKLLSYNIMDDVGGFTAVRASVEGNYKNYEVSLKLDGVGALSGYACSCESHSIWRGACKHVVAVLFAHAEGHARMFSAEKMRRHAKTLTSNLEKIIYDGIDESFAAPIHEKTSGVGLKLTPVLHCNSRGVYLTFTVGYGRMYVVKSISGFVKSFRNNETVSYGQGLAFEHRREMFDETSRDIIDFIVREDEMYSEISKRLSRQFQFTHHPLFAGRELFLTPRNTDEFFEICKNAPLECVSDFGQELFLRDAYPSFGLIVRHLANGTVVQSRKLSHHVLKGAASYYMLTGDGLFRMPKADGLLLCSLLKALDETPSCEILFSGNEQQRFLTIILPALLKMGVVGVVEGESPKGEISPLKAKMYFDSDGKYVTGRLEFHYGEVVIDALNKRASADSITRDVVAEYALCRRFEAFGFYVDSKKMFRLKGNDLIYAFLHGAKGIDSLRDCAEVFVSEDLQKKTIRQGSPRIGLRLSGDLLKVSLEDAGYNISELLEALEAYRARKKYYRLKDGRFIALEDEATTAAAGFLDALDVAKGDMKGKTLAVPAYRALYVDELVKSDTLSVTHTLKRDVNFEKLISHFGGTESLNYKTPKGLGGVLREYQKTGYTWLKTLSHYGFGGILADDMGLGKTLQAIAFLASERKEGKQSIVVAPTSLLYNWENEIIKFAPQLKTQLISGFPEKRRELLKNRDADVFITTYDMLKRDVEFYKDIEFSCIIADEAQNIKNPDTQAAKSIKELNGRVRFALTGTPIENTITELWSIFDFIMPGYLYTASKFSRIYETPIIKLGCAETAAKLRKQIAPFVLRRVKKNVLKELQDKTETTLPADFLPEQKKIYQANLLEAIGALDDIMATNSFADNRMRILAQLTRLRQICCHPALFLEDYKDGSGKLTLTLETIQLALESGHRVLLFSQFTQMLSIIKEALPAAGIKNRQNKPAAYFYLDGATKAKERVEMTERFNAGERDLFLISLKAGGTGLNLTGADVVIHYDPWWNPSVMDQAADRAHRYGQQKAVQVFNIVAKDSIEEKIMSLQEKKRDLIDSVITEGGSFINLLSEEEVRKLFS
ncbi:MAG: DEAD/DEAH box helicase [Defluviitaleaceae bacterium]|nr:DEAD/DEAH box helicase [Defluviitaleaceae bacterium]MCL2263722.1 DEAD/DEAH box helicase [Defluviitaleaceae bacterium]